MSRRLRAFAALAALTLAGWQRGFPERETGDIYLALLLPKTPLKSPMDFALAPWFLTDSGGGENAGRVSDAIVARLLRAGAVAEVCRPSSARVPTCVARRAHGQVRLSRPIARGADAADVYVTRTSIRPTNDTTSLFFPAGGQERCRMVRRGGRWSVAACVTTTVL